MVHETLDERLNAIRIVQESLLDWRYSHLFRKPDGISVNPFSESNLDSQLRKLQNLKVQVIKEDQNARKAL